MKFHPGQEVVCINDDWKTTTGTHPKKGDLVVVDSYDRSTFYVCLVGYEHSWYIEMFFEELPSMEEINEALEVLTFDIKI